MVESTKKEDQEDQPQIEAESPGTTVKRNWADDEDEHAEDDDEKVIGGSGAVAQVKPQEPEKPKWIAPKEKRVKNAYGDFVVTKINIKEKEVPKTIQLSEEESEEEESSEEEEEPKKEEPEEEKKCKLIAIFHSSADFSNRGRTRKEIDEGREKTKRQRFEGKAEAKEA